MPAAFAVLAVLAVPSQRLGNLHIGHFGSTGKTCLLSPVPYIHRALTWVGLSYPLRAPAITNVK